MRENLRNPIEDGWIETSSPKIDTVRELRGSGQTEQNPHAPEQVVHGQLERRRHDDAQPEQSHIAASSQQAPNDGEATDQSDTGQGDTGQGDTEQTNARAADRHRVLKTAKIEIDLNFADIPCVVRNISDTGALLNVTGDHLIPEHFILHVPMDGFAVNCQVVRRTGSRYGVKFIGEKRQTAQKQVQYIRAASDWASNSTSLDYAAEDPTASDHTSDPSRVRAPRQRPGKTSFGRR